VKNPGSVSHVNGIPREGIRQQDINRLSRHLDLEAQQCLLPLGIIVERLNLGFCVTQLPQDLERPTKFCGEPRLCVESVR
jgi:hypothetical protein